MREAAPYPLDAWWTWGSRALTAALVAALAGVLLAAWYAPPALLFVPPLIAGAAGMAFVVRRPLLHLCVVVGGLIFVFQKSEGIQLTELVWGVYSLAYLAGWFGQRLLRGERILRAPPDLAVALFLGLISASLVAVPFLGWDLFGAVRQWMAVALFAFYFPISSACLEDPRAKRAILATFALMALFVAARNFYLYYEALQSADALWKIMANRSRANERLLMAGLLGSLVFLTRSAMGWKGRLALLGFLVVMLAGIAIGLSRTVWLSVGLGLGVLFLVSEARHRTRLLYLGGAGAALLALAAALLLDDLFGLVLTGLADRFTSIGGAGTQDISLINRFYEWRTVWDLILDSPLIGQGLGAPIEFYNIIYRETQVKLYVHNTYLGVLHRHGVVGLVLFLWILGSTFARGVVRSRHAPAALDRVLAAAVVAVLPALMLSATMEGLMIDSEGVFSLMFPVALVRGLYGLPKSSSAA